VHEFNTRNKLKLHKPIVNLTRCQKGAYYTSIKDFNKIPKFIADLVLDKTRFIVSLEKYLIKKSFYSVDEFLNDNAYARESLVRSIRNGFKLSFIVY
jgi:CYTH domain-containing protein